jgi:hypothetical protein
MIDDNWGNGGPACCGPDSRMLLAVAAWLLMPLFRARARRRLYADGMTGDITAVAALIIALTGLLGALAGFLSLFRRVEAVHVLVNSQLAAMMTRVDQLTGALQGAGVAVPPRLSGEEGRGPRPGGQR